MNAETATMIRAEIQRARAKFSSPEHLLAALVEEVGELAQALLESGNSGRSRAEAIQCACVAVRIIEEGDPKFDDRVKIAPKPEEEEDGFGRANNETEPPRRR